MRVDDLLRTFVVVEVVAGVVAVLVLIGHGAWSTWRVRRTTTATAEARDALAQVLTSGDGERAIRTLKTLSMRRRLRAIAETASHLTGETRARLAPVADAVGVTAEIERRCRSRRWWRRLEGARLATLTGASPPAAAALLEDRNRWVRAQAAAWAASDVEDPPVGRLLDLLDDPERLVRTMAQDALLQVGTPAVEPLTRRLASRRGPEQVPALQVAVGMSHPAFRDPALALSRDEDPGARRWAARLLGRVGGEAATDRLDELTDDPDPGVRAAAAAGLGHLGHWPAAAHVAEGLRDPAWDVRCASAEAADMARWALGTPGPPAGASR
jgi:HEAT repeat protein